MNTVREREDEFNVACRSCGAVWTPAVRSPLWWQAKKHANDGYLDTLHVSGEKCGCEENEQQAKNAPYRVFGYNDLCEDFDIPYQSFTAAVQKFRELNDSLCVVFIKGVSSRVERQLSLL